MLADEPTKIWIIRQQKVFLNLSKNLIRNKIAFLLVTHDLQLAEKLGRRLVMQDGILRKVTHEYSIFISWRYQYSRSKNKLVSLIALFSTIGIALGVAVLIVGLSAMNGFERELNQRILSIYST